MNRRILLIDADPAFRTLVQQHVGRYRFDLVVEPDADKALALTPAPVLVVIGVDEPDKAGFKAFQKCKKSALGKTPVMLVTSTVTAASFAKHKELKTHADEYLDKRTLTPDELLHAFDQLIGLGELAAVAPVTLGEDDDLDIPMEVDEIALSDGDMVLDELVDEDEHTQAPAGPTVAKTAAKAKGGSAFVDVETQAEAAAAHVDRAVDAEMDDAFAALLGDDMFGGGEPAPAPEPVAALPTKTRARTAPVEVLEREADLAHEAPASPAGVVRLDELARMEVSQSEIPVEVSQSDIPIFDEPHHEAVPEPLPDPMQVFPDIVPPEDVPEHIPAEPDAIPEPVYALAHDDSVPELIESHHDAIPPLAGDTIAPPMGEPHHDASVPEPIADGGLDSDFDDHAEPTRAGRYESQPSIPLDSEDLVEEEIAMEIEHEEPAPVHVEPVAAAPAPVVVPEPAPPTRPSLPGVDPFRQKSATVPPPGIDLGLDAVAMDAESEQSGVYDRRSLRKIDELTRTINQLKIDLERARQEGGGAAKGPSREREFLNLRETLIAREKELQKHKDDLAAAVRELADLTSTHRTAQQGRTALESKAFELEKRLQLEMGRATALEAREKTLQAQHAAVSAELEAKHAAATNAEAARVQIERDLAAERARAAAGASEAERSLRLEREQLIGRHQGELATLRTEGEKQRDAATAALRAELEAAHQAALAAAVAAKHAELEASHAKVTSSLTGDHAGEVERLRGDHARELATMRDQHASALEGVAADHGLATQQLREHGESTIARLTSELSAAKSVHATEVAALVDQHRTALGGTTEAHAAEIAELKRANAGAIATVKGELAYDAQQQRDAHAKALADLQTTHAAATAKLAAELAAAKDAHADAIAATGAAHADAIAQARAARDAIAVELAAAHDDHAKRVADTQAGHVDAIARLRDEHATALEAAGTEAQVAIAQTREALERAHASALAEVHAAHDAKHEAAAERIAALEQGHAAMLASVTAEHEEKHGAAVGRIAALEKEMEDLVSQHEAHKSELHDRNRQALDAKAAEHAAALAALQGNHEAAVAEHVATREREVGEQRALVSASRQSAVEATAKHQREREAAEKVHQDAVANLTSQHERAVAQAAADLAKAKAAHEAELAKTRTTLEASHGKAVAELTGEHAKKVGELGTERDELRRGLSTARDATKRLDGELATAVQTIADRNAELRAHQAAIAERDQRIAELRKELEGLEAENASYQEQVLRAYQKIKTDEAIVTRARKAMAIALTVLDDQSKPD